MAATSRPTHRDALLRAARELLRERDYANITARELVAASGTNLGSIGYHFGSKEALLDEAVGQALEDWAEAIARTLRGGRRGSPLHRATAWWRAALDDFEAVRPYFLAFVEALPRSGRSPELARRLGDHYERQRERIATVVADIAGRELDAADARALASLAIAMTDGLMLQAFVDRERAPTAASLAAALGVRPRA